MSEEAKPEAAAPDQEADRGRDKDRDDGRDWYVRHVELPPTPSPAFFFFFFFLFPAAAACASPPPWLPTDAVRRRRESYPGSLPRATSTSFLGDERITHPAAGFRAPQTRI